MEMIIRIETKYKVNLNEKEYEKLAKIIDDYLFKVYQKKLKLRF